MDIWMDGCMDGWMDEIKNVKSNKKNRFIIVIIILFIYLQNAHFLI